MSFLLVPWDLLSLLNTQNHICCENCICFVCVCVCVCVCVLKLIWSCVMVYLLGVGLYALSPCVFQILYNEVFS